MPEPDNSPWLSQGQEENKTMNIAMTPEALSAMAQRRHRADRYLTRGLLLCAAILCAGLLYNGYTLDQLWLRCGQAWTLGVVIYLVLTAIRERQHDRSNQTAPGARFLAERHDARRRGYLSLRNRLALFLPGIGLSWLGNGTSRPWLFLFTATDSRLGVACIWQSRRKGRPRPG